MNAPPPMWAVHAALGRLQRSRSALAVFDGDKLRELDEFKAASQELDDAVRALPPLDQPCGCVEVVNAELASRNTVLTFDLLDPFPRTFVDTTKARQSERTKPVSMQATCCPFCGVKYPERTS